MKAFVAATRQIRRASSVHYAERVTSQAPLPVNSVLFSLIQPTGKIHLGNYLGALQNWRELIDQNHLHSRCIFGVADLHALTSNQEARVLRERRYETIASIIASGISPEKCILYHQSAVSEHSELCWILNCLTSMGQLNRMTQWKSKSSVGESGSIFDDRVMGNTKAGLLNYPVLQAADILLYKSTAVPVGDDQAQHLELCRSLAGTFNSTYKTDYFPLPNTLLTPTRKVLSLRTPTKKMSKSDPAQTSCIYVNDLPEVIAKKIRGAVTDSIQGPLYYDAVERPGVSNLIDIIAALTKKSVESTVQDLAWVSNHKQLKDHATDVIVSGLESNRKNYNTLVQDMSYLEAVCREGNRKAKEFAQTNMEQIRRLVGLN